MQVPQHITDLLPPTARTRLGYPSRPIDPQHVPFLLQDIAQGPAFDKIHRQVVLPTFDKEVAHARDARMIEIKQHGGLASKPLDSLSPLGLALKFVQHLLHGTVPVEAYLYGTIDSAPFTSCY